MLVKFIYKDDYHKKIHYISEEKFDESTMIKQEDDTKEQKEKHKKNLSDMLLSKTAPGLVNRNTTLSVMHNNKLDEGAVENLIDVGFDGAKKRIDERTKKLGAPYIKKKNYKLRRKKR